MNIAIINNLYEPFARGGAERIAKLQFEGLAKNGHNVITISLRPYGSLVRKSKNHYYINSIFPSLNRMPKFLRLFWHFWDIFNFVNYFKIKKILKAKKIDTVITHNMTGIGKLTLFYVSKNYRHVHILHDIALLHPSGLMFYGAENILDSIFAKLFQRLTKIATRNINLITSPSSWLLDLHLQKGLFKTAKTNVLPNPIKVTSHLKLTRKSDSFTFLYVGLIAKAKGLDVLLNAFSRLNKSSQEIKLILIGKMIDGNLQEIIDQNMEIDYLSELKNEEIMINMQIADCLIMPSVCYENSPTVVYEAMSQGTPVISSEIGGATELIEKFGGLLFEPGNELALRKHMENTIKNSTKAEDEVRLSKSIKKLYNLESYILSLESIINYRESR